MRRTTPARVAALTVLALVIGGGGALAFRALRPTHAAEADEKPAASAIKVERSGEEVRLVVPLAAQSAGGLVVRALEPASTQPSQPGLATVLSLQPLLEQRRVLDTATLESRRAALAAGAAGLEVRRLTLLHADDRIVSDKALETAQVAAATENATLANARGQITLQTAVVRQQWGPVIAGWMVRGSGPLDRLIDGRAVLLQLSAPDLAPLARSRRADLMLPDGARLRAEIVGAAALADPKFQAPGYYALAPARPALLPGVTVPVAFAASGPVNGVVIPDEAVVRSEGKPYVYVERQRGAFTRTPIATDLPTNGGWLVRSGLAPGARVVIHGAQLLLSQENKGAAGDSDDR